MVSAPSSVKTGSSYLTLSWNAPTDLTNGSFEAELRRSAWLLSASWTQQAIPAEDVRISGTVAEVTIRGLEPQTAYDVRLAVLLADGSREASAAAMFRTLALAPPLSMPPSVKCARHDRLLLHWVGPTVQAAEVVAYRVKYFERREPMWPVKHEVEVKLASRLLQPSKQTAQFLSGTVAMHVPRISQIESVEGGDNFQRRNSHISHASGAEAELTVVHDDSEASETWSSAGVHFWLLNLAPSRVYYVQVAAVTAGGQGQWSPQSNPLYTWRVAPEFLAPRCLGQNDSCVLLGLSLKPIEDDSTGQDEEIEKIQVSMCHAQNSEEPQIITATRQEAADLAGRMRQLPTGEFALPELPGGLAVSVADDDSGPFVVCVTDLSPQTAYTFTARAITHAGGGGQSPALHVETLPPRSGGGHLDAQHREKDEEAAPVMQRERSDSLESFEEPPETLSEAPVLEVVRRCGAEIRWTTPPGSVQSYDVHITRGNGRWRSAANNSQVLELPVLRAPDPGNTWNGTCIWRTPSGLPYDGEERPGMTRMMLGQLEPDVSYSVQVAPRTANLLGAKSPACALWTLHVAPEMQPVKPTLRKAYCNRLLFQCGGPIPDWPSGEDSDIIKYRARYYMCRGFGAFGPHGAWMEAEDLDAEAEEDNIAFSLTGLLPERQYVVQVAAVTAVGQGPWSKASERLSTWRVAPAVGLPRVLLRTHRSLVLGWSLEPMKQSFQHEVCDEEVQKFVLRALPTMREEVKVVEVSCGQATEFAAAWEVEPATPAPLSENGSALHIRWPDTMLYQKVSGFSPAYIMVVHDLLPDHAYNCTVVAQTDAGLGQSSASSAEVRTLPVAPRMEGLRVDEVKDDRISISWELPRMRHLLPHSVSMGLGLTASLEELELRGYDVRWARWTAWTRLMWTEKGTEIEMLSYGDDGRSVNFVVTDLAPETLYVIEARARCSSGPAEWCRVNDKPICTAIVAAPPPMPELVYATTHTLSFSFAGVEDPRVTSYEVRRFEGCGWTGGWRRPSEPWSFNARSPSVRVTSEKRWIVAIDQLGSDMRYSLQIRGVTQAGGVTKWSPRSEPMCTLSASGNGEEEEDFPPPPPLENQKAAVPSDFADPVSVDDFSKKIEAVLSFTMDYATSGVRLPSTSVKIPSVAEQAEELLRENGFNRALAVEAAAKLEDDASWRTKLPDFLIQQVPVVGCSTLLLRELWRSIRQCAFIAHLYGHDTRSPETQALIMTCLVPMGSNNNVPSSSSVALGGTNGTSIGQNADPANGRRVLLLVSRALARETFVRATGLKSAGQVIDLLGISGVLLQTYRADEAGNTSYAASAEVAAPGAVTSAPEDADYPSPVKCALVVFRPQRSEEQPIVIFSLAALWLLPIIVSIARFVAARLLPLLAKRVHMELPLASVAAVLIVTQVLGIAGAVWVQQNLDIFVSVPSTFIFTVYAIIPGTSMYMAMRGLLQDTSHAWFFAFLNLFNMGSGYRRWAADVVDDAALENRKTPYWAGAREWVRRVREVLWVALLLDFIIEELLGQVLQMHQWRLLGPPRGVAQTSLVEYRTFAFGAGLVSAWAQGRMLELLQRRSVLMRLLGARKTIYAGLSLLLMGAFAVAQQSRTFLFLREVSPSPWCCCMLLWIRQYGGLVGLILPLILFVLLHPYWLGALAPDTLVPLTLILGGVLGWFVCASFNELWTEKKEHLESDYRVLYLFPHMSMQARSRASATMRSLTKRGAEVGKNAAAEWVTMRVVRSAFDYGSRMLGRRAAFFL